MKFLVLFCALCASAVNCVALDREAFTFTNYDLEVRIEPEQQRMGVRGRITLRNDSATPQKNAVLQISSSLSWRSIQGDGKPLQFVAQTYTSDIDHTGGLSEAIVSLPREIAPKGVIDLDVGYEGVVVLDTTRLTRIGTPKEIAAHNDWDQISGSFTAVRGIGYVTWYPVATEAALLSEGNSVMETVGRWRRRESRAEMHAKIDLTRNSVESPPELLCSGKGKTVVVESGGNQMLHNECSFAPMGVSAPFLVLSNYGSLSEAGWEIFYKSEHKAAAESYWKAAEMVAPVVSEWFGDTQEKLRIVELPDVGAAPYESGSMLVTPLGEVDAKAAQLALVHGLTHAAFQSAQPWIYEGVAHFAQAVYEERQNGRQAALGYLGSRRGAIVEAEGTSASSPAAEKTPGAASRALGSTFDEVFYRSKAAYVWWMLRDMIGDEALKKALAGYQTDQDHEDSYLQRLIEKASKRDLQWFFGDWVYNDRGLPDFRVASVYASKTPQGYLVTITIENLGGAGAEVPVILRTQGGEVTRRLEVLGKAKASLRVEAPSAPLEVIVNDGSVPESDVTNNSFKVEAPAGRLAN